MTSEPLSEILSFILVICLLVGITGIVYIMFKLQENISLHLEFKPIHKEGKYGIMLKGKKYIIRKRNFIGLYCIQFGHIEHGGTPSDLSEYFKEKKFKTIEKAIEYAKRKQ